MKTSPLVLAIALAWAAGGLAMPSALGQSDDANARKSQDRDQDDRVQTTSRNLEERKDEHASPQIRQAPYRGAQGSYNDAERYVPPAAAPPPPFRYPGDTPGLSLQSPRTRPFIPMDDR